MSQHQYTPGFVAKSFVKTYYDILSRSPNDLSKFYLPDASFLHVESKNDTETVVGIEDIRKKVESLQLQHSHVNLGHGYIDAQKIDAARILVNVSGNFQKHGKVSRPFTQTFVLVGQGNAFFVSNSLFRYLAEAPAAVEAPKKEAEPVAAPAPVPAPVVAAPAPVVVAPTPAPTPAPVAPVVVPEPVKVVEPVPEPVKAPVVEEKPVEVKPEVVEAPAPVVEKAPAPKAEKAPKKVEAPVPVVEEPVGSKSYSDIVKKLAAANAAAPAEEAGKTKTFRTVKSAAPKAAPVAPTPAPETEVAVPESTEAAAPATSAPPAKVKKVYPPVYPVYITGYDKQTNEEELAVLFAQFGKVHQVELVRDKDFGFVKFESKEGMEAALGSTTPVMVRDQKIRVETRTAKKTPFNPNDKPKGDKSAKPVSNGTFKHKDNKEKDNTRFKPREGKPNREGRESNNNNNATKNAKTA